MKDATLDTHFKHKALDKIDKYSESMEKTLNEKALSIDVRISFLKVMIQVEKEEWLVNVKKLKLRKH